MGGEAEREKNSTYVKGENMEKFIHVELVFYLTFSKWRCHACSPTGADCTLFEGRVPGVLNMVGCRS